MLHCDVPIVERFSLICVADCIIGFTATSIQDIGEAARHFCVMIFNDLHVQNGAELGEVLPQLVLCRAPWDPSDVDVAVVFGLDLVALLVEDAVVATSGRLAIALIINKLLV